MCSGIEAATVAWHPLGWQPVAFAEIDPFASALLAHYYPDVPNLGDMEAHGDWRIADVDLLVGGTPCQSFSVAGLRGGMADPRGNLALVYLAIADQFRPEWLVWENVPGVLSSNSGRDFGAFLGGLEELGYGWAYRTLDAQYFGVPQRRRRVFVVGCLGGWQRAAAVLFERASLSGNPPPSREARAEASRCITRGSDSGRRYDGETETFVTHTLRAEGYDASDDGTGRGIPLISNALTAREGKGPNSNATTTLIASTLRANSGRNQIEGPYAPELADPITANEQRTYTHEGKNNFRTRNVVACFDEPDSASLAASARPPTIAFAEPAVRRLTPRECERLQGFPEINHRVIIRVCRDFSDQQKKNALAEILNHKSPASVSTAGAGELLSTAPSAGASSSTNRPVHGEPAALNALIDLERGGVRLHSAARSLSFAANADGKDVFRLPTGIESFARLGALTHSTLEAIIRDGRAVSQPSINGSSARLNGSSIVLLSGREIEERAAGAATAIAMATRLSTSTTFDHGLSFENLDSILTTLCCCVVRAIASFIPEKTSAASSFDVSLTTSCGYTFVPYRGKPASDSARYKALGNSMAVPVMRWIGERIQQVSEIR